MWSADPALSLAIFSVILSIFVHFISVSWLYLLISDINQIYKAVNLYAWGLFVHILLTTLLIALSAFPIQLSIVFIIGMLYYRSEEHTSELQSRGHLVCRLLLEK